MICDRLFCGGVADGLNLVAAGDPDDCVRHDTVSANLPDQLTDQPGGRAEADPGAAGRTAPEGRRKT